MPIECQFDTDKSLLICTVTGEFTFDQVRDLHEQCFEKYQTKNLIVDLRLSSLERFPTQIIKTIVGMSERKKDLRPANSKTALVANSSLKYGLSRMYQIFFELEELPWELNVFKSMDEALDWIEPGDMAGPDYSLHPGQVQKEVA